ncbi:5'-methylthioadenosine/S-adenosylhomocysteine nucleosidase [Halobacteroides halobius DSM 5150]|uniref:adenosylhomocysteine nucleosidase n=1 Tax=Halobacteroides halobius (strain ATCC 35273 / DSM 5150 / MD-1) TaxID=748449 RepID=L0K6F3_HALHC|nr:5'-methylthioadenosine/adenosylhomocysteine nucleosidase [Halobacteroides halobius]AGB40822.1 5'-methylthioadenosine/S-adenosylhomocysteine nucleosidase [Halobacteroides halobius DSM 5150]
MKLGIIGAMEIEIELLRDDLELQNTLHKAGMDFYQGILHDKEVVLVRSGIGKVNAAICTQILIDQLNVDQIIFTGVAGAIDTTLEVKDIVISTDLVQHDMDASAFGHREVGEIPELDKVSFAADKNLISLAEDIGEEVTKQEDIQVVTGRILSGDQFIANKNKVKELKETFGGFCTEMEGAAVGQVAYLNDTPFVIIRSISDSADEEADISFDEFVKVAASHSYQIVTRMLDRL